MRIMSETELVEVLGGIPDGVRVLTGSHSGTPWAALAAFDASHWTYKLNVTNARKGIPTRAEVELETAFIGPGMRRVHGVRYFPCHLSQLPALFERELPVDVVIVTTSRVVNGKVSLGTEVNILPAVIREVHRRGGTVIAEINDRMPYTYGDGEFFTDIFDYAIEVSRPLDAMPVVEADDQTKAIAANVASIIPDCASLQGGIGGLIDNVMDSLTGSRYRVLTELGSDWIMKLAKAGRLDPTEKVIMTFAFGSGEFYRWLDLNPRVRMMGSEHGNDPGFISCEYCVVSINTALEVDLFDQANANFIKGEYYSGFGGALDYTIGATHSHDGLSILALPAWREKHGISCVVPRLSNPVTTMQHSYVVTEYGIAKIWGCDADQIARNLIEVAHPSMRGALEACHYPEYAR